MNDENILPEFRVILERVAPGEEAYPTGEEIPHYEYQGRRTKLGGRPDWVQRNEDEGPVCPECGKKMTFVAQIDSVQHDWKSNPHGVDSLSENQKWMFGDVGMIYVFFCFECQQTASVFECG